MLCNKLRGPIKRTTTKVIAVTLGLTFRRGPAAGSRNGWKTRMDAIPDDSELADTEPRNLTLLFPIRDAAPMSAAGFAGIAIEAAILNDIIGHADPRVIE